jgi:hypothetical protein
MAIQHMKSFICDLEMEYYMTFLRNGKGLPKGQAAS